MTAPLSSEGGVHGKTGSEKLHLFACMLVPLLNCGRERDGIDLSALRLSRHKMRDLGQPKLNIGEREASLIPLTPHTDEPAAPPGPPAFCPGRV